VPPKTDPGCTHFQEAPGNIKGLAERPQASNLGLLLNLPRAIRAGVVGLMFSSGILGIAAPPTASDSKKW
jgi:hypothetical protein